MRCCPPCCGGAPSPIPTWGHCPPGWTSCTAPASTTRCGKRARPSAWALWPASSTTALPPMGSGFWSRWRRCWASWSATPLRSGDGSCPPILRAKRPTSSMPSAASSTTSGTTPTAACCGRCAPGSPMASPVWAARRARSGCSCGSCTPSTESSSPPPGWSCFTAAAPTGGGWRTRCCPPLPPCPGRTSGRPSRPSPTPPDRRCCG